MPTNQDIQGQEKLLQLYRRSLQLYIERQAIIGIAHISPEIAHGIQDARANIQRIKSILRLWGQEVEDLPDDEVVSGVFSQHNTSLHYSAPVVPSSSVSIQNDFHSATRGMRSVLSGGFYPSQWNHAGNGHVEFIEDEVGLYTHQGSVLLWANDIHHLNNIAYSITTRLISGSTKLGFGLVFWLRSPHTYYYFAIRTEGDYELVRVDDGIMETLIPWTQSTLITGVFTKQQIGLLTNKQYISLFIAGKEVCTYECDKKSSGGIGVYASSPGLSAEFWDISVQQPK